MNIQQTAVKELIEDILSNIKKYNVGGIINYLGKNAIAKYSLANDYYLTTQKTINQLKTKGIDIHNRANKCSKNEYTFEHAVPVNIILKELLKTKTLEERNKILEFSNIIVILSYDENKLLKEKKLNSKMPKDWKFFDNVFARYDAVGIKILDEKIKMFNAVKR